MFILSSESTVDLPYSYVQSRNISILCYRYTVDGKEYDDNMERDPEAEKAFYDYIDAGNIPSTSQINEYDYQEYFEELIQKGDVLHLVMSTGITGSYNNALHAAETVREAHPDRKLAVIDSTCICGGFGLFTDYVADARDAGMSLDETVAYAEELKRKIQHHYFNSDLKYFKRTGRVSGPTATLGKVLNIYPLMWVNYEGKMIAYSKARGEARTIQAIVEYMKDHVEGGAAAFNDKVFINHARCPEAAEHMRDAILRTFPKLNPANIRMGKIGMIIASHCGPGTLSMYFKGDVRPA